ncbi:hypothetical protein [Pedobacter duraquae]|uniref:Uncharacterized protein n=1 Tax=Pedobacter duraquae TaxID=425511 RepID=A0A4R6IFB6_9SPHI|nr:hypothetical protein [Pedobacter duraquae]TDO20704.1 hypothetical protein CLV32_3337 [Pedobacter duraquae]
MGYAKERGKIEQLSIKIAAIDVYNEKNFDILVDTQEKYSHTVRILKNKEPETFGSLYENELQAIKASKKAVRESEDEVTRQNTFTIYKTVLLDALAKTVEATLNSL